MTDNEKRAHDLAIAVLSYSLKPDTLVNMAQVKNHGELKVDVYKTYINLYNMFLQSFNFDFPE